MAPTQRLCRWSSGSARAQVASAARHEPSLQPCSCRTQRGVADATPLQLPLDRCEPCMQVTCVVRLSFDSQDAAHGGRCDAAATGSGELSKTSPWLFQLKAYDNCAF